MMANTDALHVSLIAIPEAMASTLNGLYDVLNAFETMAGFDDALPDTPPFGAEIVAATGAPVMLASGLPIETQRGIGEIARSDIVIVPSLLLDGGTWARGRYPELVASPVEEMVRRSGLAERSFKRRFTKATGFPPIGYVQRLRVEEAKRRLERTDAPVDEIGWNVGYEDPAFFRRLFKRVAGITPGAYRRKFKVPAYAAAGPRS